MLTGTIDDPAAAILITIIGNNFNANNNGNGTWTLPAGTITPLLADGTYDVVVQATDPAGNIGTDSTTDELNLIVANFVADQSPTGTIYLPVSSVDLTFSRAMDTGNFSLADDLLSFTGPGGVDLAAQVSSFEWVNDRLLRINFVSQVTSGRLFAGFWPADSLGRRCGDGSESEQHKRREFGRSLCCRIYNWSLHWSG